MARRPPGAGEAAAADAVAEMMQRRRIAGLRRSVPYDAPQRRLERSFFMKKVRRSHLSHPSTILHKERETKRRSKVLLQLGIGGKRTPWWAGREGVAAATNNDMTFLFQM